jgi:hypothetical protein
MTGHFGPRILFGSGEKPHEEIRGDRGPNPYLSDFRPDQ